MIDYVVNRPEDESKVNAFIWDLRDLMARHGVSLEVMDYREEGATAVFTCYEDIENLEETDFQVDWFCEIVDMWPQHYSLADNGKIIKVNT